MELADQFVSLLQHDGTMTRTVRESRDDPVAGDVGFECNAAAVVDCGKAAPLHQRQDAEDLASSVLMSLLLDALAQSADVPASNVGSA